MPLNLGVNEEIEIQRNSYSNMLNSLNPRPISEGDRIIRRHKIAFKTPQKKSSELNKNESVQDDKKKINLKESNAYKSKNTYSSSLKSTGFLSLD